MTYLSKLKHHKNKPYNQKYAKRNFNLSLFNIQSDLCRDINAHNDQGCTGIELALLSSAETLKERALTTRPLRHISNQNKWKYIDRRSKGVTTGQKIMNEL